MLCKPCLAMYKLHSTINRSEQQGSVGKHFLLPQKTPVLQQFYTVEALFYWPKYWLTWSDRSYCSSTAPHCLYDGWQRNVELYWIDSWPQRPQILIFQGKLRIFCSRDIIVFSFSLLFSSCRPYSHFRSPLGLSSLMGRTGLWPLWEN